MSVTNLTLPTGSSIIELIDIPANPQLSPGFDRARNISRVLAVLLSVAFYFMLVVIVFLCGAALWPFWPSEVVGAFKSVSFRAEALTDRASLFVAFLVGISPYVAALHHGRRTFAHFARGEVFASKTIAHICASSLWLMVAGIASGIAELFLHVTLGLSGKNPGFSPDLALVFFGLCTYVAAYVMAEARRLADENASII